MKPNKPSRHALQGRWWIFCWATPLFGVEGGPCFWGIYAGGFQLGYWERPEAYERRLKAEGRS